MSDFVRLTGLWKTAKNGKTYLTGTLGHARVFVFQNAKKTSAGSPDYYLSVAPKPPEDAPARAREAEDDVSF